MEWSSDGSVVPSKLLLSQFLFTPGVSTGTLPTRKSPLNAHTLS